MSTGVADRSSLSLESRRNLALLTVCQAVGQSSNVIMLSVTALSVITFFPYRELATLPATLQHLGVMLSVFPAAAIMMRRGRGFGFRVGSVFGMTGAGLCGLGLHASNFLLMCVGGLLLGYAVAALQMYRFAAVELVGQRVDDGHEGQRATQQRQLPGIDLAGNLRHRLGAMHLVAVHGARHEQSLHVCCERLGELLAANCAVGAAHNA